MLETLASMPDCAQECWVWAAKYFGDCVCNPRDAISFTLGLANIVLWAICELPQILDNYHSDDAEGLSLTFIFAWLIGDIFNVVGCYISDTVRFRHFPDRDPVIAGSMAELTSASGHVHGSYAQA
jgi:hypothetical protein